MIDSGIYVIINTVNGHKYVGSAVNLHKRWINHKHKLNKNAHHSRHLQSAWNKYGADCFEFAILEYCEIERLIEREQFYIDTVNPAYNISPTAGNNFGVKYSEESKLKMSGERHPMFGKHRSDEIKQILSEANTGERHPMFGKHRSEETKQKISKAKMGERNPMFGKHPSEETKQRMSQAHMGVLNHNFKKRDSDG